MSALLQRGATHACTRACMHTCMHTYVHACQRGATRTHAFMHACMRTCMHTRACIDLRTEEGVANEQGAIAHMDMALCACTCIGVHVHACPSRTWAWHAYMPTHACPPTHAHPRARMPTHAHACPPTHAHPCMHTHACTGAITQREHTLLVDNPRLTEKQRHHAVLEWIVTRFVHARATGLLEGGAGLEVSFREGCTHACARAHVHTCTCITCTYACTYRRDSSKKRASCGPSVLRSRMTRRHACHSRMCT